jgi:hypothetical protein
MVAADVLLYLESNVPAGTNLWATERIIRLLSGDGAITDPNRIGRFGVKLQMLCDANFQAYIPTIVKREFGKTYCIHLDQYRLVGFFHQGHEDFICLDYFVKKTQRNDRRMNAIYAKVDSIREAKAWTRQR